MTLFEFNNLDIQDKHSVLFGNTGLDVKLIAFRDENEKKYSLWYCESFYIELCAINGKVSSIIGIEPTDDKIDLYIDFLNEIEKQSE
jgi:hypothetical protein